MSQIASSPLKQAPCERNLETEITTKQAEKVRIDLLEVHFVPSCLNWVGVKAETVSENCRVSELSGNFPLFHISLSQQ